MPQEPEDFDALHGATEPEAENASLRHALGMALNHYRVRLLTAGMELNEVVDPEWVNIARRVLKQ